MELIRLDIGDLSDEEYRDGYRNMSASRREKCDRYLHETDRKCCIAADWAVRRALCARFGGQPAEIAHHKIYLTAENVLDPAISLNPGNLEALCMNCHNAEHFGQGGATAAGRAFDENGNLIQKGTTP